MCKNYNKRILRFPFPFPDGATFFFFLQIEYLDNHSQVYNNNWTLTTLSSQGSRVEIKTCISSLLIEKDSSKILSSRWWSAEWKLVSPWKHVEREREKKGEDGVRHRPVETTVKRYAGPRPCSCPSMGRMRRPWPRFTSNKVAITIGYIGVVRRLHCARDNPDGSSAVTFVRSSSPPFLRGQCAFTPALHYRCLRPSLRPYQRIGELDESQAGIIFSGLESREPFGGKLLFLDGEGW